MKHLVSNSTASFKENTSLANLGTSAAGLGVATAGILVAHNGLKLAGMKENFLVNLGLTAASIAGLMYVNNPLAKLAILGIGIYALTNTISIGVKEIVAPSASAPDAVKGLSGLIPASVKMKIAQYIPNFGNVEDAISGYPGDGYSGTEELNLDEHVGNVDEIVGNVEEMEGIGSAHMAM